MEDNIGAGKFGEVCRAPPSFTVTKLTQCINSMVSESHPPHKIVNLVKVNNKTGVARAADRVSVRGGVHSEAPFRREGSRRFYLTKSVYKVVLQKLIPAQIRQLILYISNNKG